MADKGRGDFILLSRKMLEWEWWDDANMVKLWLYILLKANWKESKFKGETIPRGTFVTSTVQISVDIKMARSTVVRNLKKLENGHQISIKSNNKFSVISVINYAKFQGDAYKSGHQKSEETDNKWTSSETTSETTSGHNRINKQVNKGNKKDKGNFVPPSLDDLRAYAQDIGYEAFNAEKFLSHYTATGWKAGRNRITDWREKVREWKSQDRITPNGRRAGRKAVLPAYMTKPKEDMREATAEEIEKLQKALEEHRRKQEKKYD